MPLGLAAKSPSSGHAQQDEAVGVAPDQRRFASRALAEPNQDQKGTTQAATRMGSSGPKPSSDKSKPASSSNSNEEGKRQGADGKLQHQQLAASLRSAAAEGKVDLVRLLLKCGADVNAPDDEFGNTPLHQAAWNGFSETVQVLCKHRANTNAKNKASFTPLHMASQQGHNQTSRLLLMANARTDSRNSYGDTPLHTATRYGHAGVARILLSAKCNPNLVNMNNDTPLHIAAAMGRRKLTKILMQNGAELVIKNKQNETAMDIALRKDLIEIQELIANPPPKASHRSHRGQHNHHQHQHHHHHHHHRHSNKDVANNGCGGRQQREETRQLIRHRKSMTNLISGPASCSDERAKLRFHGLSISSNNVQCAAASRPTRLGEALGVLAAVQPRRPTQTQQERHEIDIVGTTTTTTTTTPAARVAEAAKRQQQRKRTQTLGAGLGISAGALDELTARARAAQSDLVQVGARSDSPRPRPSSAAGHHQQQQQPQEGQQEPVLEHHRPAGGGQPRAKPRLRLSPSGSVRSSRVGGARLRGGRGLVPKPRRRSTLAGGASPELELQPDPLAPVDEQPTKLAASKRRAASLSILNSGRLSLVQLRRMVKRRAAASRRLSASSAGLPQAKVEVGDEQNESSQQQDDQRQQPKASAPVVPGGRRQERLERELKKQTNSMVAPNGTKLTVSKPLAPLDDESQLYAIPRKSSKTKQHKPIGRAEVTEKPAGRSTQAQRDEPPADSTPRDEPVMLGPALTASESNQTLASVGRLSPVADTERHLDSSSSSDEFIESLAPPVAKRNHHDSDSERHDLSAPGYSVIRRRPASGAHDAMTTSDATTMSGANHQREPTGACTCLLEGSEADYAKQVACGVEQPAAERQQRADNNHQSNAEDDDDDDELLRLNSKPIDDQHAGESADLIRPRSVLGGANAELVAAQKNLAAAAAAKVHRDRLAKFARAKLETQSLDERQQDGTCGQPARTFQQLTVATQLGARPDFWLQHHQLNQTLVATATARLQTKPAAAVVALGHHQIKAGIGSGADADDQLNQRRGGANSVGMSDSSPSNNGADSDNSSSRTQTSRNSIQLESDSTAAAEAKPEPCKPTASGPVAAADVKREQPSRPFGILSRILSHNKPTSAKTTTPDDNDGDEIERQNTSNRQLAASEGNAPKRTNNNSSRSATVAANGLRRIVQTIASGGREQAAAKRVNKREPAQTQSNFSGSVSSSSALSSPSISTTGQSPNSTSDSVTGLHQGGGGGGGVAHVAAANNTAAEDEGCALEEDELPVGSTSTSNNNYNATLWQPPQAQQPLLDLLGSRSRCPIVLGDRLDQANGLPVAQSELTPPPPRLPPKNALGTNSEPCYDFKPDVTANGLPAVGPNRCAGYLRQCDRIGPERVAAAEHDPGLCSYHALNRSHQIQAKYSPYLPYSLGRYAIHETCDPSTSGPFQSQSTLSRASGSNLSQYYSPHYQDNGRMTTSSNQQQQQQQQDSASLLNVSMVCHYSQDDSIYIPHLSNGNQPRFAQHQHHPTDMGHSTDYQRHLVEAAVAARPKSSLAGIGLNGPTTQASHHQARAHISVPGSQPVLGNRQHRQLPLGAIQSHESHEAHRRPMSILKSSQNPNCKSGPIVQLSHPELGHRPLQPARYAENGAPPQQPPQPSGNTMNPTFDSSHLITQNSIYASGSAFNRNQKCSELTVLPTSSHTTNPTYGLHPSGCARAPSMRTDDSREDAAREPAAGDSEQSGANGRDKPPQLPPKTTTTTVGKLTRVSINQTTSSSSARGEILIVRNSMQRRAIDEENPKVQCEATEVTSC